LAERGFQTELWTDPFVQGLSPEAKLLFIYLWTNKHCNQAGLYEISLKTTAFDTGLLQESLPALLKQLEPKVAWYPEQNLIWVKNFLKRQCKSQSFLIAAAKCLKTLRDNGLVKEFIDYNQSFDLAPLYEDGGGTVLPPSYHSGNTVHNPVPVPGTGPGASAKGRGTGRKGVVKGRKGVVKGGKGAEKDIPRSRTEIEETLCEGDREVTSVWCSVKGFNMTPADASALVARLRTEFTDLDILAESKAWAARKLSEPLKRGSKSSAQIWNWMRKAREFAQERRQREQRETRTGEHQQDPVRAWREAGWDTEGEPDEPGKPD